MNSKKNINKNLPNVKQKIFFKMVEEVSQRWSYFEVLYIPLSVIIVFYLRFFTSFLSVSNNPSAPSRSAFSISTSCKYYFEVIIISSLSNLQKGDH